MKCSIKILHAIKGVAKNGNKYVTYVCLITIGENESIRKFVVFEQ